MEYHSGAQRSLRWSCLAVACNTWLIGPLAGQESCHHNTGEVREHAVERMSGRLPVGHPMLLDFDQFFRVTSGFFIGDSVFVANSGTNEILVFGASHGRLLEKLGRSGGGPGEFSRLNQITRIGHVLVSSDLNGSVTFWNEVPRRIDLRSGGVQPLGQFGGTLDNALLVRTGVAVDRSPPADGSVLRYRPQTTVFSLDSDGTTSPLFDLEGVQSFMVQFPDGRISAGIPPYACPLVMVGNGERIYVHYGQPATIDVLDGSGQVIERLRFDMPRKPINADAWRREADRMYAATPGLAHAMGSAPRPSYAPVFGDFILDDSGRLWAGAWTPRDRPGRDQTWTVVDPRRRSMRLVQVGGRVLAVAGDRVLVVRRDDLDVESVVVLRVERPR